MTRIPTAAQLERLIDEVRPILDRVPQLIRQAHEWADEGVKGVDPGKVNVRGGSITNPTEAAALRGTRCQWGEMVERIQRNERAILDGLTLTALRPELSRVMWVRSRAIDLTPQFATQWLIAWRAAAEQLIADARTIDHRYHELDRKTKNKLDAENSTGGVCEWCGHYCRGARQLAADGTEHDDRRRRIAVSDVWTIGLCNACHAFTVRRWPEGQPMSDVSRLDEIRKQRDQHLADQARRQVTA